jgi:methylmalonyl-CoA mutase N-terminal domain/subunit
MDIVDPRVEAYMRSLLDRLDEPVLAEMEAEGVLEAVASGATERAIADAAYRHEQGLSRGDVVSVGVNRFRDERADAHDIVPFTVPQEVLRRQLARLDELRAGRDESAVREALDQVEEVAAATDNTMPAILDAVRAYATVGEISAALARVFGRYEPPAVV